jgi:hypothetical protein
VFREWRSGRWRGWILYLLGAWPRSRLPGVLLLTVGSAANVAGFFGIRDSAGTMGPPIRSSSGSPTPASSSRSSLVGLLAGRIPWVRQRTIARRRLAMFLVPFLVWFIVPNVLRLAPWIWDNIKVLFYWWVGMAPLVALVLATWWHRSRALGRAVVVGVLISLTLAGSIDVWRAASGQTVYEEYAPDSLALAAAIRDRTQPDALILSAPTWNPTVFLTGRPSLLGYTGYIWAHGLPYTDRERDIEAIYAGGAEALPLLRKYGIDYVELTPVERDWMTGNNASVSDAFFGSLQIIAQSGDYRLYEVPHG